MVLVCIIILVTVDFFELSHNLRNFVAVNASPQMRMMAMLQWTSEDNDADVLLAYGYYDCDLLIDCLFACLVGCIDSLIDSLID